MAQAGPEHPAAPVPEHPSLPKLSDALPHCRACDLWEAATQAVPGAGVGTARVMLIGEQPGDREDLAGLPFVGPAGRVLDEALERAGIDRAEAFTTNAVKHFRYKARGKRRIHQRPDRWQVTACLPWLMAELTVVAPEAIVALGATAAQALFGTQVRIGRDRGQPIASELAALAIVTTHPSSILRVREANEREWAMELLVADLAGVATWLHER